MCSIWKSEKQNDKSQKQILSGIGATVYKFFTEDMIEMGYEEREGQFDMACDIVQAMIDQKHILVESGVGIGKTYAYILPLLLYHQKYKRPVIIATSTIALQEQLFFDLKKIMDIFNYHPEVLIVKGQSHFLCKDRLEKYFFDKRKTEEYELYRIINRGGYEKSDWNIEIPERVWNMINVTAFNPVVCRQNCSHKDSCYYYQLRNDVKKTNGFIVCNQDLLTMNLRKRNSFSNEMLATNFQYVVIDEAHNLESKVRNSYTIEISYSECKHTIEALWKVNRRLGGVLGKKISRATSLLENVFQALYTQIQAQDRIAKKNDKDIERYYVDKRINGLGEMVEIIYELCDNASLDFGLEDTYKTRGEDELVGKMEELCDFFDSLLMGEKDIFWMNISKKNKYGITISKCPKNVNELTEALFFNSSDFRVILTSATISSDSIKNYDYFISNTNLPKETTMICESKESPFDYDNRAMIYYTENIPHPSKERDEFIKAGIEEIIKLLNLTDGKALILFTAKRDMIQVYDALKERVPYNILMQSEGASQNDIISEFKRDENSVLLGTGSYWEGISIEGRTLSNLIIFRLPFPVPEPIIDYKRRVSSNGLMEVSVPEMIIKLKQGIGRLIRNKNDSGIVSIIDSRLGEKSRAPYKEMVWASLPIKNITNDFEKIKNFYLNLIHGM